MPVRIDEDQMIGLADQILFFFDICRRFALAVLGVIEIRRGKNRIEVHRVQIAHFHFHALFFHVLHRRAGHIPQDAVVTRIADDKQRFFLIAVSEAGWRIILNVSFLNDRSRSDRIDSRTGKGIGLGRAFRRRCGFRRGFRSWSGLWRLSGAARQHQNRSQNENQFFHAFLLAFSEFCEQDRPKAQFPSFVSRKN